MTLPATNGFARTMCLLPQKLSDTLLKGERTSILQTAKITGNTRRSKSAVPGWYKKMSMGSDNVSSEIQYAGMSPSSRFVTSSKNGALVRNVLKNNDIVPKQYLINQLNSLSRSLSENSKPKIAPRSRSMPRWNDASVSFMDREIDQISSREIKPKGCNSLTELSGNTAENLEDKLSEMETEYNVVDEGLEPIEESLMNNAQITSRPVGKDSATSFKRTVNINLNELDRVSVEPKKTLSMDINVVVSVKSPENGLDPEIGFQELPGKEIETRKNIQSTNNGTLHENIKSNDTEIAENLKMTDRETAENLKFGSEQRLFSQKEITEEIGKVYNFLKTNDGTKSMPINSNPISSNIVKNYDAVKKLYLNALGCVKACEVLKNNGALLSSDPDEFSDLMNELEGCFLTQDEAKNSTRLSNDSQERQKKYFLAGTRTGAMGIRTYSSKSDCNKAKKLPCLLSSELSPGEQSNNAGHKSVCERMCMPCCKPARDPPRCFYPYHKQPCKKLKAPRPAFSECKQLFEMKQISPCECARPRATKCKKPKDSETCAKR